jgi:predicted transcriptional regulator of viral defense system
MNYTKKAREHFEKKNVFTIRDLKNFLPKKINKNYHYLLIHNLLEKKEITRLTRGVYTFKKDAETIGFAFFPFYYGLQDALSIHGLWEQETNPVIITPRKVRTGIRNIMDSNVLVRKISRKMFFGFKPNKIGEYWVPVSDIEKTLIDLIYYKEPVSPETIKEINKRINKKKLKEYLKKTPEKTRKKINQVLKKSKTAT